MQWAHVHRLKFSNPQFLVRRALRLQHRGKKLQSSRWRLQAQDLHRPEPPGGNSQHCHLGWKPQYRHQLPSLRSPARVQPYF